MRAAVLLAFALACKSPGDSPTKAPPRATMISSPKFEAPAPTDPIVSLGRGPTHACVVRASGNVDCWGQPVGGPPDPTVRRVPGLNDAVSIRPQGDCVVRKTGDVACLSESAFAFVPRPGMTNVASISSGDPSCFVARDGTVGCDSNERNIANITDATHVSVTYGTLCITRRTGDVMCNSGDDPFVKVAIPPATRLEIRAGVSRHACALLTSGELQCFAFATRDMVPSEVDEYERRVTTPKMTGATDFVLVGESELDVQLGGKVVHVRDATVEPVPVLADTASLAAGCAVRTQGSVVCWGRNDGGVLGYSSTLGLRLRPPVQVVGATAVAMLALGGRDSYAVTTDNKILRWGKHGKPFATELVPPPGTGAIKSLVVTRLGSVCILDERGSVQCWTTIDEAWKTIHTTNARLIAAESSTILSIGTDNSITRTRTDNEYKDEATKQPAPLPIEATMLAAGQFTACVSAPTSATRCGDAWEPLGGANQPERLLVAQSSACEVKGGSLACWHGYGSERPAMDIPTISGATDIAVGPDAICTVIAGGRVQCWDDRKGFDARDVIASGAVDVELSAGTTRDREFAEYGCAIMRDRTVQCWGSNLEGELGDGSLHGSGVPVAVPNL